VYEYGHHPYREDAYYFYYFDEVEKASRLNIPIGMELECRVKGDPLAAVKAAKLDWILETDGSLCSMYGVEIVSPPLCRKDWRTIIPKLTSCLMDEDSDAYSAGDKDGRMYGIHLTVSREYLTPLQEVRLGIFLLAAENADFIRAIAKRTRIYNASLGFGSLPKTRQVVRALGKITRRYDGKTVLTYGLDKYTPLRLKGAAGSGLAEFRIFQASLRATTLSIYMEFVWALVKWTDRTTLSGTSWRHEDFVAWLKKRPKEYPKLVEYLQKPEYSIKYGEIKNTWWNTDE
jgi:hypothetical protein